MALQPPQFRRAGWMAFCKASLNDFLLHVLSSHFFLSFLLSSVSTIV